MRLPWGNVPIRKVPPMHVKTLAAVAVGVTAAGLLVGCSSSSSSTAASPTASMVGGMTECTDAILKIGRAHV